MFAVDTFLSTLSQLTLTFLAFTIAIVSIIDRIKRNEVDRRINDLREDILEFKKKYFTVLNSVHQLFTDRLDEDTDLAYLHDINPEHLFTVRKEAHEDSQLELPETAFGWAILNRTVEIIYNIGPDEKPNSHYLLSSSELQELKLLSMGIIHQTSSPDRKKSYSDPYPFKFLEELSDRSQPTYDTDLFSDEEITIGDFERNEQNDLKNWIDEDAESLPGTYLTKNNLSGKDMKSLNTLFIEFEHDIDVLFEKSMGTILDFEPILPSILRKSAILGFIGTVIPLFLLLLLSNEFIFPLSVYHIAISQLPLFILSVIISLWILNDLYNKIST